MSTYLVSSFNKNVKNYLKFINVCENYFYVTRFFSQVGEFGGNYYYHIIYMDLFAFSQISLRFLAIFYRHFGSSDLFCGSMFRDMTLVKCFLTFP